MKNNYICNKINKSVVNEINCKKMKIYSTDITEFIINKKIGKEQMIIIPEDDSIFDSDDNKTKMTIYERIISI
ncbi:MAG: hypothetical protein HeimC3_15310 [Candidatus Heimdallarchaeota archaeon LC_3]|nr:MAG: hypothetical protein HeimC3_15310 [Candidatus Heimdallarchaeota archaeon LC_3]